MLAAMGKGTLLRQKLKLRYRRLKCFYFHAKYQA